MEPKFQRRIMRAIMPIGLTLVFLLPFIAWGNKLGWQLNRVTTFGLFPLFGLWAFALMWFHFFVAVFKRRWPKAINYRQFYRITANFVLVLIVAHPLLLVIEAQSQKFSVLNYGGSDMRVFVMLGVVSLVVFLLYGLFDKLRDVASIKKYWPAIKAVDIAAFTAIFFHGLYLGQNLQSGWLRFVWISLGISAAFFVIDSYRFDIKQTQQTSHR